MDGTLDVGDLLTVALLAAAASFLLRRLLRPVDVPIPDRARGPSPAAPVAQPAASDDAAAPVDVLLVGESPAALAAAEAAADRHHLPLRPPDGQLRPSRATCRVDAAWPPARLVVVGSTSRDVRDVAVQQAACADVPLLLTAGPAGRRTGR